MAEHPIDEEPVKPFLREVSARPSEGEPAAEGARDAHSERIADEMHAVAEALREIHPVNASSEMRHEPATPSEEELSASSETQPDGATREPAPTINYESVPLSEAAAHGADEAPGEPIGATPGSQPEIALAPAQMPAKPRRGAPFLWSLVGAVVGVVAVAGIPYAMGYRLDAAHTLATLSNQSRAQADAARALAARVDELEARIAQRPAADPRLDELAQSAKGIGDRVGKLEALGLTPELLAALKPSAAAEGATSEPRIDNLIQSEAALGARLSKLEAASPSPAAASPAPELEARLARLENALAQPKTETRVEPAHAQPDGEPTAAAVAALALQQKLAAGRPYAPELATLTRLHADAGALETLKPFADKGAPSAAALAAEFDKLAAKVAQSPRARAPAPAESQSAWARWTAPFRDLVKTRPVGEVAGEAPAARVSQTRAALARGDIAAALAAFAQLPDASRAAAADWAKQAEAVARAGAGADSIFEAALGRIAAANE